MRIRVWLASVAVLSACQVNDSGVEGTARAVRDAPTSDVEELPPPGRVDFKEGADTGDDPKAFGCELIYNTGDATCGTVVRSDGDWCSSPTVLHERTLSTTCSNAVMEPAPKVYDCTKLLDDPKARCITIDDFCLPGDPAVSGSKQSARCAVPGANAPPKATDYCACPVETGETIIANECPTRDAGDDCAIYGCDVQSKDGKTTYHRRCDRTGAGPGSGGSGSGAGSSTTLE
jgi:hypothetical protein